MALLVGACGGTAAPVGGDGDADGHAVGDADAGRDTACVPAVRQLCCGAAVCADDGCGPQRILESCPEGCVDGACVPCTPSCDGRVCGDDGCGGVCGTCEAGAECADDGTACACAPEAGLVCCEGDLCVVDSCGVVGDVAAACAYGCDAGACLACDAPCGDRVCGDNGCGESCGTCEEGEACEEGSCVCVPDDHVACCADGAGRCTVDSCGVEGDVVEACAYGCADGACAACVPACEGRVCGTDGCGGSCGPCDAGTACDAAGQCTCTAAVGLGCGPGGVYEVDSCGGLGAQLETCPYGCAEALCLPCVPACEGKDCGPDGCGGVCGDAECAAGKLCVDGLCSCVDDGDVACCGAQVGARCAIDSCGVALETLEVCLYGCAEGACLPCPAACGGRSCGDDGCGGSCGTCQGGAVCSTTGACECVPAGVTCCGDARCALDSCGETGEVLEACAWGCDAGACSPCPASCVGRACGTDGCGGSCGTCDAAQGCDASGQCVDCVPLCDGKSCGDNGCGGDCGPCAAGSVCADEQCVPVVTGRFLRERILPNASLTALGASEVVPAAGVPVVVTVGGAVVGQAETDGEGRYAVQLAAVPVDPITVTLVAAVVDPATGAPVVGVADASGVSFPTAPHVVLAASRLWAWTATGAAGQTEIGDLTVTTTDGSGALQVFLWLREQRAFLMELYGVASVPTLGALWSPTITPLCLSCFFPSGWGPLRAPAVGGGSLDFVRFIWFSGAAYAPHQWTPSMVGHEYGHYVMDVFSRSPNEGGAHSWDGLLSPGLAWSEGFATYFGQRWLSGTGEQPRFFAVQSGTQYWVDIDRIGTTPTTDDSVFGGLVFPLPQSGGTLTQTMNEAVVAAILWDLWDSAPLANETEGASLDDLLFALMASPRMVNPTYERGYAKADLVDLLDAIRCADALPIATLMGAIMGFPYDNAPKCPP